jgi:hypothetical protein
VVLAIISILMGIGAGVLSRLGRRNELEATTAAVRALLRRARASAQEEHWGALVEVDPQRAELRARLRSTITRFRFDGAGGSPAAQGTGPARDPTIPAGGGGPAAQEDTNGDPVPYTIPGAKGFELTVERAEQVPGRQGEGLAFLAESAWGAVADQPILSPAEGIYAELYLYLGRLDEALHEERPRRAASEAERYARAGETHRAYAPRWVKHERADPPTFNVVRKGRAWGLAVTIDYELEAWVAGGHPDKGEVTWIGRTRPGTLVPERWYRVAFAFDGERARVLVDGIARHALPLDRHEDLPAKLLRDPAPLTVSDSDPDRGLFGVIDELVVATIVSSERLQVPADVLLFAPDEVLAFDQLGQLDPTRHAEPFGIWLTDAPEAFSALAPAEPAPAGAGAGTRTRAEAEAERARNLGLGATPLARFEALRSSLAPERVKRLVVERTGLVR